MKLTEKIIVVDLEATCWNGNKPENEKSEIIEIGICELNTNTGEISKSKGILIYPQNSKVSEFCTQLTTITQEMIDDDGISLQEAFEYIENEYDLKNNIWASYGYYDYTMLEKEAKDKNLNNIFSGEHINIKIECAKLLPRKKRVGMAKALSILNIPLEGTHHRGVDDAKNIAKILKKIINYDKTKNG